MTLLTRVRVIARAILVQVANQSRGAGCEGEAAGVYVVRSRERGALERDHDGVRLQW